MDPALGLKSEPTSLGRGRSRARLLATIGPAFVAAVAYVDPGNFATNFAGGVEHGYELAWSIVLASIAATLVQYVTSKTGLATGQSLPQLCSDRFGRRTNVVLWLQAEVVAMATDLAEFVGAAVGLNLAFGIPLLPAGVLTALVAFAILLIEQRRRRGFVLAIAALFFIIVGTFAYLFVGVGNHRYGELGRGLLPNLGGSGGLTLVVAIVGATVMPHVIYAHSALQSHHGSVTDVAERHRRLRLNRWDCVVGLGTAGIVNLAMLCIAAALPGGGESSSGDLAAVHDQIERTVGGSLAFTFGIALIASGFASSTVGTYAGQVVMSGFVRRRIPLLLRRGITMVPSLVILGAAIAPSQALVYSQVALSFGIPFALVPLVLLSRDRQVMKDMTNRRITTVLLAVITVLITGLNVYLIYNLAH